MERDSPVVRVTFLRRSPEKDQKGVFKKQQFRVRQKCIAKFEGRGRGMCVGEDSSPFLSFFFDKLPKDVLQSTVGYEK